MRKIIFKIKYNIKEYYSAASLENKQKMLGLIFPEKLVFSTNTFQTMQPNEVLTLLCNGGKGFSDNKKEKSTNAAQSCVVTSIGFKPITFPIYDRDAPLNSYGHNKKEIASLQSLCDLDRIQTYNLLIRSQMLYSIELRSLNGERK